MVAGPRWLWRLAAKHPSARGHAAAAAAAPPPPGRPHGQPAAGPPCCPPARCHQAQRCRTARLRLRVVLDPPQEPHHSRASRRAAEEQQLGSAGRRETARASRCSSSLSHSLVLSSSPPVIALEAWPSPGRRALGRGGDTRKADQVGGGPLDSPPLADIRAGAGRARVFTSEPRPACAAPSAWSSCGGGSGHARAN